MKFGYARVSTIEQNLDLQIAALKNAGCEQIFFEKRSGVKERPELEKMINMTRNGDIIIIWKIDRLARSLMELLNVSATLQEKGVDLVSIDGKIDTTTPMGRMYFQIAGAFAEFERALIVERTKAGLMEAKKKGVKLGRRKGICEENKKKAIVAKEMYGKLSPIEICQSLNISIGTLYRYLKEEGVALKYNYGRKKKEVGVS